MNLIDVGEFFGAPEGWTKVAVEQILHHDGEIEDSHGCPYPAGRAPPTPDDVDACLFCQGTRLGWHLGRSERDGLASAHAALLACLLYLC